ncbi:MAG: sialate O-acetylesterase [Verrucomicrobiota bacterium]
MRTPRLLSLLTAAVLGAVQLLAAEFRLAAPISDHMVLQRGKPVAVWGFADAGEKVSVEFGGQSKQAVADGEGRWIVRLDAMEASARPRTLVATGKEGRRIEVKDVLVGEVWLGSGQSNMAMTVQSSNAFEQEKAAADLPLIRHFKESSGPADKPQPEGKGSWSVCAPDTVGGFSATLYFFGRELHRELGVPVGLVNTSVGGTPIEAWVSAETQSSDPETKADYDSRLKDHETFDVAGAGELHRKQIERWKNDVAKAKQEGKKFVTPAPKNPLAMRKLKGGPAHLYNGKVVNLAPYAVRGMLWYQGEGNAHSPESAELYVKQLSQLVTSWRALWQDEVPFAWVQLPNYRNSLSEGWPRMRESMTKVLALPRTGMAITLDVGDPKDIHPKNKQAVGHRLALWALGTVYDRKVPATSGPLPAGHQAEGSSVTVSFKHGEGLKTRDGGAPRGFLIAGSDKVWKPATARIEGDKVVVSSPEVSAPVAVRYAWAENPDCNLVNGAGLPATTFRTDDWPAVK